LGASIPRRLRWYLKISGENTGSGLLEADII
jgi:hypothetical protein